MGTYVSILFEALLLLFCTSHRGEARSNPVRALIAVDESVAATLAVDNYLSVLTLEAKSAEIEMVAENKQRQWLGAFLSTVEAKAKNINLE